MVVAIERSGSIRATPLAVRPRIRIALAGFRPRLSVPAGVRGSWQRPGDAESLGFVRVGAGGGTSFVAGARGTVADLIAQRPAGTPSPVALTLPAGTARTTVRVPLPAPPALSVSQAVVSEGSPGSVTIDRPEVGGNYALRAEWTCETGVPGALDDARVSGFGVSTGAPLTARLGVESATAAPARAASRPSASPRPS